MAVCRMSGHKRAYPSCIRREIRRSRPITGRLIHMHVSDHDKTHPPPPQSTVDGDVVGAPSRWTKGPHYLVAGGEIVVLGVEHGGTIHSPVGHCQGLPQHPASSYVGGHAASRGAGQVHIHYATSVSSRKMLLPRRRGTTHVSTAQRRGAQYLLCQENILWARQVTTVKPPILNYVGDTMAPPQWAHKAQADYLDLISSDFAQYAHTPIDRWEHKQVVNSVLLPRWLHRAVLMAPDRWYREVHKLCATFVQQPKGMVPGRSGTLLNTPIAEGGMGMHQLYWAYQRRCVTIMQHTLRHQATSFHFGSTNR